MEHSSTKVPKSNQHNVCLISDSKDLNVLKGYERHYLIKSEPLGFVFCSRIPSPEELQNYYANYPREEDCGELTKQRYRELLAKFEPYRKTNKILDVGCGSGFFLEEARLNGWEVYGTEYAGELVEICEHKNIRMQSGKLYASWYPGGTFDVITSFEVIEHINNPKEEIQNIQKILRKGGLLYVTTPNFNALERFVLKDNYNVIEYPEHLCYYTRKTLNYLMQKNGFKNLKTTATGFSVSRFRNSTQTISTNEKQVFCETQHTDENLRRAMKNNLLLRMFIRITNFFLNLSGTGNALKGWYVKL